MFFAAVLYKKKAEEQNSSWHRIWEPLWECFLLHPVFHLILVLILLRSSLCHVGCWCNNSLRVFPWKADLLLFMANENTLKTSWMSLSIWKERHFSVKTWLGSGFSVCFLVAGMKTAVASVYYTSTWNSVWRRKETEKRKREYFISAKTGRGESEYQKGVI